MKKKSKKERERLFKLLIEKRIGYLNLVLTIIFIVLGVFLAPILNTVDMLLSK